ncbi:hypothetical protein [uncultured phage cr112_1]|jgi:hypothetical protein|uniref:Uncharacterized protein n=1 Tax=uncultured phage cr112_1 TaxID=2772072 RepID=A0A7M1S1N5_9CAUD|nr:hypothetical protein KNV39_gp040 [uncultured phage cr112_1]QOR59260.1 hypothetical protein [uncultured phage cr112_1]DAI06388.1 MAG TPA: hypothetical protein [Crassvirales sp.]
MNILRGNDIKVTWSITKVVDGVPIKEDLDTVSNLTIYVNSNGRKLEITDYIILNTNQVQFTIKGRNTRIGNYSFEASWSKDYDARITESSVFTIVDDASQCDNTLTNSNIMVNSIEVKSNVQIAGDLSNYYTKEEVNKLIEDLKSQFKLN